MPRQRAKQNRKADPYRKLQYRCQQTIESLFDEIGCDYKLDHFAFQDNGSPILAVAHCDSVDCGTREFRRRGNFVRSTCLDDRLGIHIILDVLPTFGLKYDILLTDDEEKGDSTAQYFTTDKTYNWMFQFDRRGTDCVTYDYDEMDILAKGFFNMGIGSFSDICWLDNLKCGGMNVGTGYYNEHTERSFAVLSDTAKQVARFVKFYHEYHETWVGGAVVKPKLYRQAGYGYTGRQWSNPWWHAKGYQNNMPSSVPDYDSRDDYYKDGWKASVDDTAVESEPIDDTQLWWKHSSGIWLPPDIDLSDFDEWVREYEEECGRPLTDDELAELVEMELDERAEEIELEQLQEIQGMDDDVEKMNARYGALIDDWAARNFDRDV